MSANELQILIDKYSQTNKVLDSSIKQMSVSLDFVIKTYENLHLEENHQLKILIQKY
jgi:hypothetical protein